ncbi:MAG: hypothetical protein U5K75_10165 [Ahrensia sp.]|nr:hypothetical protein [Ahrensia sp.]
MVLFCRTEFVSLQFATGCAQLHVLKQVVDWLLNVDGCRILALSTGKGIDMAPRDIAACEYPCMIAFGEA